MQRGLELVTGLWELGTAVDDDEWNHGRDEEVDGCELGTYVDEA